MTRGAKVVAHARSKQLIVWLVALFGLLVIGIGGYRLLFSSRLSQTEAGKKWAEYQLSVERQRGLVTGVTNLGEWEAHMPEVCVEIPEKPTWSRPDVERLLWYARLDRPRTLDDPNDVGRRFIADVAASGLTTRFKTGQGMEPEARETIYEYILGLCSHADPGQRKFGALTFIHMYMHYSDARARKAVLAVAKDPDPDTAFVVRLQLGYYRDAVRRIVAAGRAEERGIDPSWANDPEIEALSERRTR